MSSRSKDHLPWPAQTLLPASSSSHTGKGKRSVEGGRARRDRLFSRAPIANQSEIDAAKAQCQNVDNAILSCWPTAETIVDQGFATQFVWNSRQPSFSQFNLVDIELRRADTGEVVQSFTRVSNPSNQAGSLPITAGDAWWGSSGATWSGSPIPFAFSFAIVESGSDIHTALPQPTFTAIQTTFASSVIASMSSSSSAAAASSSSLAAALSSESLTRTASTGSTSGTGASTAGIGGSTNGLQGPGASSSSFPHWAIAVIVVLGFFALLAFIALVVLIITRVRRRRNESPSRRGSLGSQRPMIENDQGDKVSYTGSPPLGVGAGIGAGGLLGGLAAGHAASTISPDAASTHSDSPFSGADAAVMAEAFRKALRKPDFAGRPVEEGESPEGGPEQNDPPELLNRELAEEGRDLRSVGSSRGVRVETLSDDGDTATGRDSQV